jgi:hypothetical protein
MKLNYRPLLLAFAVTYAGLAVASLLIAMNLAQGSAASCVSGHCPGVPPCCLPRRLSVVACSPGCARLKP